MLDDFDRRTSCAGSRRTENSVPASFVGVEHDRETAFEMWMHCAFAIAKRSLSIRRDSFALLAMADSLRVIEREGW